MDKLLFFYIYMFYHFHYIFINISKLCLDYKICKGGYIFAVYSIDKQENLYKTKSSLFSLIYISIQKVVVLCNRSVVVITIIYILNQMDVRIETGYDDVFSAEWHECSSTKRIQIQFIRIVHINPTPPRPSLTRTLHLNLTLILKNRCFQKHINKSM